jgi:esterase/lipase superfamily enzyme
LLLLLISDRDRVVWEFQFVLYLSPALGTKPPPRLLQETYLKYYSHQLQRDVEMLVFGDWGYPLLLFPTTLNRFYEAKDQGLIESVRSFVESGQFKIYCVDTLDAETWYGRHLPPAQRVQNYQAYDQFLTHELVPYIQRECHADRLAVGGCSFGGFHALNFAFRHPELVGYLLSMSGDFDIRGFMGGHYDENVYFMNPVDYMPNEQGWRFGHMNIVLGTSEWDICLNGNLTMSRILNNRGITHWLDIRGPQVHDWPLWRQMFREYLAKMT